MLPPYSPFLNIVEQAISALKAAIKADISRPDIQATIDDRDEARRQGIPLGEYRQRILLEASQRNMNTGPLRLQSTQGGTDSCRHIYYLPAGRSVLRKTVPEVLSTRPRAELKTEGTVFLNTDRPRPANNIFIFFLLFFKS